MIWTSADLETAFRTVYGEARSEPEQGKIAVAWVIRNRVKKGGWWGENADSVCRFPWQFSCWNDSDPNKKKILSATVDDEAFRQSALAVAWVFSGLVDDPTNGATHYHTKGVNPPWSAGKEPSAIIGNHRFFNNVR